MDQFKSAARSSTGTTAIFTEDANQSKALDQKPSRIGGQSLCLHRRNLLGSVPMTPRRDPPAPWNERMSNRDQRKQRPVQFGKYTLLDRIGSGGMAEIFRAKMYGAHGFEKELAIKKILPHLTDDKEFVEMFIDEAKIMVGLVHGNIVQVYDLGEIEGQYFIGMEFVQGKDLLDVLARCAEQQLKLPLKLSLFILAEALKGLDYAHKATDPYGRALGLIHRDVSPSNVLISYAGDVKIGDFGVAKATTQRTMTEAGTLKGKVGYMSPEQVRGDSIDHRSDLFSVGIMMFEILNMRRLFIGGSDLDIMLRVRDIDIDREMQQCIPLPVDLKKILTRALSRLPDQRPGTAMELHDEIMDFLFRHRIRVTNGDVARFMEKIFSKELQQERERRHARRPITAFPSVPDQNSPAASGHQTQPAPAVQLAANEPRLRYRDRAGSVHGPMDTLSLVSALAKSSSPGSTEGEWVSQGSGPWIRLQDMPELYAAVAEQRIHQQSAGQPSNLPPQQANSPNRNLSNLPPLNPPKPSLSAANTAPTSSPAYIASPTSPLSSPSSSAPNAPPAPGSGRAMFDAGGSYLGSKAGAVPLPGSRQGVIGDLDAVAFGNLLMQLWKDRATGRLKLTNGERCKELQLKQGNPVEVSSNNDAELLGNFLIREGVVTQTQVHRALQRSRRFGGRLGDALVADRVILSHVLYQYLFRQAKAKVLDIFTWPQSDYEFISQEVPNPTNFPLGLETLELIVEGVRGHTPTDRLTTYFDRHGKRPLRRTLAPAVHMDALRLSARELRIATVLEGRSVHQLIAQLQPSRVQPEEVYRLAFLLLQLDLVHFTGA